jgi:hypothetical protein
MYPNQTRHDAKLRYWQELLLVGIFGMLLHWAVALRLEQPSYMDAYYYAANGQRLSSGGGFTELVIWQFLDDPSGLPTPSHTYWMPLPSLLAAAGYKVIGEFRGAQAPFWILAGLLPLLSYSISRTLSGERWQAMMAALLTASGGFYVNFLEQPTTFAPFAWAAGVCLLALAHAGQHGSPVRWWFLAGVMAGLAHLTRADGVLLMIISLSAWAFQSRDSAAITRSHLSTMGKSRLVRLVWLLFGYFLIMGGWFARGWIVSGRPLSTVGTQTIFLTTYDDLFAYGRVFDLSHLLNWGWSNILNSRLQGLSVAAQTVVAVTCFTFLTPFVIWAWLRLGREPSKRHWLRPMSWYALVLFSVMSIIFTFPGSRGGLFHSSAALWPWSMALAPAGLGFAVDWAAARLTHWKPERAKRIFAGLFVGLAFVTSAVIGVTRAPDEGEAQAYLEIEMWLPETAVVMAGNAPGFYYHTGLPSVSVPNEPADILLQAATRYRVTHLILDENRPQPLKGLYEGHWQHPAIELIHDFEGRKLYKLQNSLE